MPNITPMLWFDDDAEQAATFYTSTFPNSRIDKVVRAASDTPSNKKGDVITVEFTLDGTTFVGLNGGPDFKFNEAVSFVIDCKDQAEVDHYWDALIKGGGEPSVCGWLKDKFGLSWQVVPSVLGELMTNPDPAKANRVTQALMQMGKIDIATLEAARDAA